MKKVRNLERKLNEIGYDLILKDYDKWSFVPTAVNRLTGKTTALVWVEFLKDSATIVTGIEMNTNWNYIKSCLEYESKILGIRDFRNNYIGYKHIYEFDELDDF